MTSHFIITSAIHTSYGKYSTPAPCRKAIKEALTIMMSGSENDLISYIDRFRDEYDSLPPEVMEQLDWAAGQEFKYGSEK